VVPRGRAQAWPLCHPRATVPHPTPPPQKHKRPAPEGDPVAGRLRSAHSASEPGRGRQQHSSCATQNVQETHIFLYDLIW
jgi:hypothetical protein